LLRHVTFDRAEIFSTSIRNTLEFFRVLSVFALFYLKEIEKTGHPTVLSVSVKEVSAQMEVSSQRKEGEKGTHFFSSNPHISLKEAFENFESMTTFTRLIEIYQL
jgi:hypothetical protein